MGGSAPPTTAVVVLSTGAAAAALYAISIYYRSTRRPPSPRRGLSWKWPSSSNKYWTEDERGDEQEESHEPKNVRHARASRENFQGEAKCFVSSGYNAQLVTMQTKLEEEYRSRLWLGPAVPTSP